MSKKKPFKELVRNFSDRTENGESAEEFIRELVLVIESGLQSDRSVSIAGFGKFELRWMKERKGRNPQTGEEILIPGQNKVIFKPHKPLREHVNRSYANMAAQILEETGGSLKQADSTVSATSISEQFSGETPAGKEETLEELMVERPSPLTQKQDPAPVSGNMQQTEKIPEPAESGRKKGLFRWTYAATSILVLILLAAFLYTLDRQPAPDNTASTIMQRQPAPAAASANLADEIEQPDVLAVTVESGQSLWSLAGQHLNDPYLWPWIYYRNDESISNPNVILAGSDLSIPLPSDKNDLSNAELQEVGYGYLSIYHWYKEYDVANAHHFLWAAGFYHPDLLNRTNDQADSADLDFARNR